MKNYNEALRMDIAVPGGGDPTSVVSGKTDIKVKEGKVYDTSSSQDAFSSLSAGDTVKLSGFDSDKIQGRNNKIATVTDVESGGHYFKVDKTLVNVAESDIPDAGIDVEKSTDEFTVNSDMTKYDYVNDVVILTTSATSTADLSKDDFGVTNDGNVASFTSALESTDTVLVLWSDGSLG